MKIKTDDKGNITVTNDDGSPIGMKETEVLAIVIIVALSLSLIFMSGSCY